jgi:hypothetical protein
MNKTREAVFIDKQKLIEAIEKSTIEIEYVDDVYDKDNCGDLRVRSTRIKVIDAQELLYTLRGE